MKEKCGLDGVRMGLERVGWGWDGVGPAEPAEPFKLCFARFRKKDRIGF